MLILESEGHFNVIDHPQVCEYACEGCGFDFEIGQEFESLVDRICKRCYMIHPRCWEAFENKLKGGEHGNLPAWAQP